MLDKLIKFKGKNNDRDNNLMSFQLAEAKEIADLLIQRIEDKINALKELENAVDKKIAIIEKLLQRADLIKIPSLHRTDRYDEILYLKNKGLKIEEIVKLLDIPAGEVELFLNLKNNQLQANLSR